MKPAQRMVERKDLEKLQKKSDFLKNPRFVPLKSATDAKKDTKADIDKEAQRYLLLEPTECTENVPICNHIFVSV